LQITEASNGCSDSKTIAAMCFLARKSGGSFDKGHFYHFFTESEPSGRLAGWLASLAWNASHR
jgi:hypothetical protein